MKEIIIIRRVACASSGSTWNSLEGSLTQTWKAGVGVVSGRKGFLSTEVNDEKVFARN